MKAVRLILVAGMCLAFSSCTSSKPKDLIVGKWSAAEDEKNLVVWDFAKDGTLEITMGGEGRPLRMRGKYKFIDDSTLEVERDPGDPSKNQTVKVSVTKKELILTDEKGKVMPFKRAK